jgi:hypothetical protein
LIKFGKVKQAKVVSNKRFGAVLQFIQEERQKNQSNAVKRRLSAVARSRLLSKGN